MEQLSTKTMELQVELTDSEVHAASMELAELTARLAALEEEKKAVASSYKERMDRIVCDTRSLARKVTTGKDVREVECRVMADYDRAVAITYRNDTSAEVTRRPLSELERQRPLEFDAVPEPEPEPSITRLFCHHPICNSGRQECAVHAACPDFMSVPQIEHVEISDLDKIAELVDTWGWSRNAAKLLNYGFVLVMQVRESREIFVSDDHRLGWVPKIMHGTFAESDRYLQSLLNSDSRYVWMNTNGTEIHFRKSQQQAGQFKLFRREEFRIKTTNEGGAWSTWKKFKTEDECTAAWNDLLANDPKALED